MGSGISYCCPSMICKGKTGREGVTERTVTMMMSVVVWSLQCGKLRDVCQYRRGFSSRNTWLNVLGIFRTTHENRIFATVVSKWRNCEITDLIVLHDYRLLGRLAFRRNVLFPYSVERYLRLCFSRFRNIRTYGKSHPRMTSQEHMSAVSDSASALW
jgi:hypothetical protein